MPRRQALHIYFPLTEDGQVTRPEVERHLAPLQDQAQMKRALLRWNLLFLSADGSLASLKAPQPEGWNLPYPKV